MMKQLFRTAILTAAVVLFAACATTSGVPEWVNMPPEGGAEYLYFTGVGSAHSGEESKASIEAGDLIISGIIKYLGLRITPDTTIEARTAYEEFKSRITAVIREKSEAGQDGLRVAETWTDSADSAVVVHLLVEYSVPDLEAEKLRLEELFKEKKETISESEKKGDELFEEKRFYRASVDFIEAALEESISNIDDANLRFERNIMKAIESVQRVSIEIVSGPGFTYVGEAFDEKFIVKLSSGEEPAEGLPVTISYKELRANGRKSIRTHTVLTDEEGLAVFESPVPEWVGKEKITFFLDMRAVIEPLEDVSFDLLQYVDGLEQAVNSKTVSFEYEVFSRAVEVPTCVMVMDVDRSGNPLDKTDTAAGIVSVLSAAGFEVNMIPVDYRMTAVSDTELIKIISAQYGNLYERMVFGTAEISSFEENSGNVIVKVTGKIKTVELESGRILFSASEQKRARGGSNSSTISAAFLSLGKMYGNKLISDLP